MRLFYRHPKNIMKNLFTTSMISILILQFIIHIATRPIKSINVEPVFIENKRQSLKSPLTIRFIINKDKEPKSGAIIINSKKIVKKIKNSAFLENLGNDLNKKLRNPNYQFIMETSSLNSDFVSFKKGDRCLSITSAGKAKFTNCNQFLSLFSIVKDPNSLIENESPILEKNEDVAEVIQTVRSLVEEIDENLPEVIKENVEDQLEKKEALKKADLLKRTEAIRHPIKKDRMNVSRKKLKEVIKRLLKPDRNKIMKRKYIKSPNPVIVQPYPVNIQNQLQKSNQLTEIAIQRSNLLNNVDANSQANLKSPQSIQNIQSKFYSIDPNVGSNIYNTSPSRIPKVLPIPNQWIGVDANKNPNKMGIYNKSNPTNPETFASFTSSSLLTDLLVEQLAESDDPKNNRLALKLLLFNQNGSSPGSQEAMHNLLMLRSFDKLFNNISDDNAKNSEKLSKLEEYRLNQLEIDKAIRENNEKKKENKGGGLFGKLASLTPAGRAAEMMGS
jgi:hypothetical protein